MNQALYHLQLIEGYLVYAVLLNAMPYHTHINWVNRRLFIYHAHFIKTEIMQVQ